MHIHEALGAILEELRETLSNVDTGKADLLTEAIVDARMIFVAGAGRSGLATRCFAMRLMHLGKNVHVVGDSTTPGIAPADLLLIGSGSGSTAGLVTAAEKAHSLGARIALLTIRADSPIASLADIVLTIPAPTPKISGESGFSSVQPMGSLFEQALLLTFDALILLLMGRTGVTADDMFARHANIE